MSLKDSETDDKGIERDFSRTPVIKHSDDVITNKHWYRVSHTLQINFDKRGASR